jgi:hypothetical protein
MNVDNSPPVTSQPATAESVPKSDARYYRFGLCGLTTGGKTCILAALALPRVTHPNALTATLLPVTKRSSKHLKDGWNWVNDARECLRAGRIPPPNPHGPRLTIRYKFTDGAQREVFVELVDYSGELLDSKLSETELAKKLHGYFGQVHGFLFVAEHPEPGAGAGELGGYLQQLKESLARQRSDARNTADGNSVPIALLINKWDRSGTLAKGQKAHEHEMLRLEAFLQTDPPPPHAGLLNELKPASGNRCRPFPVSAFGEAVREPGNIEGQFIEKPAKVTPELPSFGLEEPFLWLVEQRDTMDAEKLESASRLRRVLPSFGHASTCRKEAQIIAARMSKEAPNASRVAKVRRRMKHVIFTQTTFLVLVLVASTLGIEFAFDAIGYRKARVAMTNPAAAKGWHDAEAWFTDYAQAKPWLHLAHRRIALTNEQAIMELQTARAHRDDLAWQSAQSTKDDATRVVLARRYLTEFPQGTHIGDAQRLLADDETRQRRDRLSTQLQTMQNRLASLQAEIEQTKRNATPDFKPVFDKLQQLQADAQTIPEMDAADSSIQERRAKLVSSVGKLVASISGDVAKEEMRKAYFGLMGRGELEKAANHLLSLSVEDFKDLRIDFQSHALQQIEAAALKTTGNGAAWDKGLALIGVFRTPELSALLPEGSKDRLDTLETTIKQAGDRFLYEQCSPLGSAKAFDDYLAKAPLGAMKQVVEQWQFFRSIKQRSAAYRISVTGITWGWNARNADTFWNDENSLTLSSGSQSQSFKFNSDRKTAWRANNSYPPSIELKEVIAEKPMTMKLDVWDVDSPDGWDFLGGASFAPLLEDLNGQTNKLSGTDYGPNEATFRVEVLDAGQWREFKKPPLPSWSPPY